MNATTLQQCNHKGCAETAEHKLIGAARLCVVHFLRHCVRRNGAGWADR